MAEGSHTAGSAGHEAAAQAAQSQVANTDWLNSAPAAAPEHFSLMDPFHTTWLPLDSWVTHGIDWVVLHFRPLFQGIRVPVDFILSGFQHLLLGMPAPVAIFGFRPDSLAVLHLRDGRGDTGLTDRHRRYRRVVTSHGDTGAGSDLAILLHPYRATARDMAGA
ncbi:Glycine betaine/L-proline transport system permease protein proW [Yersinia bercovieri ATCC 43970]|uniref:Glycine betaine/L-proline transport system permease protein proW n=1 Tax=Yersinia bercovieri ATCC 43970 TaxID=349968 RepID=A0ABP2E421_YERBE|nr:Glycine betaine/L-proline transport system permease protein proW [Yersinia bercovieri ATCC 43970]